MRATVSTTTVWYHPANSLIEDDDLVGQGGVPVCDKAVSNVDRSTPEHAVHSTGSVGGGGQRGTGATEGLKRGFPDASQILIISEMIRMGVGLI